MSTGTRVLTITCLRVACGDHDRADTRVGPYRRRFVVAIAALVIGQFGVMFVSASDATPTADVPPAALCTAQAPSFERLNEIVASPVAEGTPKAVRTPGVVPEGTPADAETVAAVTAVVQELVGCYNAGDLLRSYGLYTDEYLHRLFSPQGGFTRAAYDSLATPEPAADPGKHTAILAIKDVRVLDDGTVGATVTLRYAGVPVPKSFFFTFVRTGDRWLISGILGEISFSVP
jgi:ketosteroid isomerase-like protein